MTAAGTSGARTRSTTRSRLASRSDEFAVRLAISRACDAAADALRRLLRRLRLGVEDLLEDLAHAGPHELGVGGVGIPVAAADTLCLARIQVVVLMAGWSAECPPPSTVASLGV